MKKEKKSKRSSTEKIILVSVCVVLSLWMILSGMSTSGLVGILQTFKTVKTNDSVTIDFTLQDANNWPVLTSNQNLYQTAIGFRYPSFLTQPLTVRAGYIGNPPYTGVQADNYYLSRSGTVVKFGILGQELDELDAAVLGMKAGDTKTIHFSFPDPLTVTMKRDEFAAMGGNFTNSAVGDFIPLGFSETPMVQGLGGLNSTPTNAVLRIGTVINKTADSIEIQDRYPSANITVKEFK